VAAALARRAQRGQRPHSTPMINQGTTLAPVAADERAGDQHQGEPPPRVSVPAHLQPPKATQPRQRALDLPPMAPQPRRRLHPTPSDPRPDPTPPRPGPVGRAVAAPCPRGPSLAGCAAARRRADRRDVVQQCHEHVVSARLAAVTTTVSGGPPPSQTRAACSRACHDRPDLRPRGPPRLARAHGVRARPRPVQPALRT
jgi:hypothetical protein